MKYTVEKTKDINDIMLNTVRMRIIQTLTTKQTMTTTEICEIISDVPRTTLYRHIKILLDNNLLAVVSEQKIRGSLERTLSLNVQEMTKHNTRENATQNAYAFLMNQYAKFQKYFEGERPNQEKQTVFVNSTVLMTTDDEFNQFLLDLQELLIKYSFEFAEGRKARDISIISAPTAAPEENECSICEDQK